jgi:hypothetical protein
MYFLAKMVYPAPVSRSTTFFSRLPSEKEEFGLRAAAAAAAAVFALWGDAPMIKGLK